LKQGEFLRNIQWNCWSYHQVHILVPMGKSVNAKQK